MNEPSNHGCLSLNMKHVSTENHEDRIGYLDTMRTDSNEPMFSLWFLTHPDMEMCTYK